MTNTINTLSRALHHMIDTKIKQNGPIPFSEFMKMALYEPGLGYYSAGLPKFGSSGDFITAPEISPLFARTQASLFVDILRSCKQPVIVELGAGSGRFCVDVLTAMLELGCVPDSYIIVEVSADLKARQQSLVQALPEDVRSRVTWSNEPPQTAYEGIVFANEVIDALPVEIFSWGSPPLRLHLGHDSAGQWQEQWHEFPEHLESQLRSLNLTINEGYRSEFIPHFQAWLSTVLCGLQRGFVIWIDYGYGRSQRYQKHRNSGTLVCARRHQAHFDPYQDVGLQDISTFVDFTALAEALVASGFELQGFVDQGQYLLSLGLLDELVTDANAEDHLRQANAVKQLTLPDEMGERFKVLAASKGLSIETACFAHSRWHEL